MKILTTVYAHGNKESMWEAGEKIGLTGEALKMFSYTAHEVMLTVEVDADTGKSKIVAVDGKRVEKS